MKRRKETGEALATVQAVKAAARLVPRGTPLRNRRVHQRGSSVSAVEKRAGFRG
ncbi:MAG TPA: hypothetical protein VNK82_12065 [Terriglobales bacterium]|nr:hypothetical protein [Terriglobales bacterium]